MVRILSTYLCSHACATNHIMYLREMLQCLVSFGLLRACPAEPDADMDMADRTWRTIRRNSGDQQLHRNPDRSRGQIQALRARSTQGTGRSEPVYHGGSMPDGKLLTRFPGPSPCS